MCEFTENSMRSQNSQRQTPAWKRHSRPSPPLPDAGQRLIVCCHPSRSGLAANFQLGRTVISGLLLFAIGCSSVLAQPEVRLGLVRPSECDFGTELIQKGPPVNTTQRRCQVGLERGRDVLPPVHLGLFDASNSQCCGARIISVTANLFKKGQERALSGEKLVLSDNAGGAATVTFSKLQLDSFEAGSGYTLRFSTFYPDVGGGALTYTTPEFTIIPQSVRLISDFDRINVRTGDTLPSFTLAAASFDFTNAVSSELQNNMLWYRADADEHSIVISDGMYTLAALNDAFADGLMANGHPSDLITLSSEGARVVLNLEYYGFGVQVLFRDRDASIGSLLGFESNIPEDQLSVFRQSMSGIFLRSAFVSQANGAGLRLAVPLPFNGVRTDDGLCLSVRMLDRNGDSLPIGTLVGNITIPIRNGVAVFDSVKILGIAGKGFNLAARIKADEECDSDLEYGSLNSTETNLTLLGTVFPNALGVDISAFEPVRVDVPIFPFVQAQMLGAAGGQEALLDTIVASDGITAYVRLFNESGAEITADNLKGTASSTAGDIAPGLATFDDLVIVGVAGSGFYFRFYTTMPGDAISAACELDVSCSRPCCVQSDAFNVWPYAMQINGTGVGSEAAVEGRGLARTVLVLVDSIGRLLESVNAGDEWVVSIGLLDSGEVLYGALQGNTTATVPSYPGCACAVFSGLSIQGVSGSLFQIEIVLANRVLSALSPAFDVLPPAFTSSSLRTTACGATLRGPEVALIGSQGALLAVDTDQGFIVSASLVALDPAWGGPRTLNGSTSAPVIDGIARFTDLTVVPGPDSECWGLSALNFTLSTTLGTVLNTVSIPQSAPFLLTLHRLRIDPQNPGDNVAGSPLPVMAAVLVDQAGREMSGVGAAQSVEVWVRLARRRSDVECTTLVAGVSCSVVDGYTDLSDGGWNRQLDGAGNVTVVDGRARFEGLAVRDLAGGGYRLEFRVVDVSGLTLWGASDDFIVWPNALAVNKTACDPQDRLPRDCNDLPDGSALGVVGVSALGVYGNTLGGLTLQDGVYATLDVQRCALLCSRFAIDVYDGIGESCRPSERPGEDMGVWIGNGYSVFDGLAQLSSSDELEGGGQSDGTTGVAAAGLLSGRVIQSNSWALANNTLHFTLRFNVDLSGANRTAITIAGLFGSLTPASKTFPVDANSTDDAGASVLEEAGTWSMLGGYLIIRLRPNASLAAAVPLSFSISLVNPLGAQHGSPLTVSCSGTHACTPVPLHPAPASATPLTVQNASMLTLVASQALPFPGAPNNITFRFASSAPLTPTASTMTFRGLTGSSTSQSSLAASVSSSCPLSLLAWTPSVGSLALRPWATIAAGTECSVSFTLRNPSSAQPAPTLTLVWSVQGQPEPQEFTDLVSHDPRATLAVLGGGDEGDSHVLKVDDPGAFELSLRQSTPYPGAVNTLTLLFTANVALAADTTLNLTGLGPLVLPSDPLPFNATPAVLWGACAGDATAAPSYGDWCASSGTCGGVAVCRPAAFGGPGTPGSTSLLFSIRDSMPAGQQLAISFDVLNPLAEQRSPNITLVVLPRFPNGLPVLPETRLASTGRGLGVLGAHASSSAPLHIMAPGLALAQAGQASSFPLAANTITVTLAFNVLLTAPVNLTLSFDPAHQLPDAVTVSSADVQVRNIVQANGSVSLQTVADLSVGVSYRIALQFTNPLPATDLGAAAIQVSGVSSCAPNCSASSPISFGPFPADNDASSILNLLGAVAGDAAPLVVQSPAFAVSNIGQSSPYPSASNTMSITLVSNRDLGLGAQIVIEGLVGSATPNDAAITVDSDGTLSATGSWEQAEGRLKVGLTSLFPANQTFVLSFTIVNPSSASTPPPVFASADIASSSSTLISATLLSPDLEGIPAVRGAVAGHAAPLSVQAPGMVVRTLATGARLPGRKRGMTLQLVANLHAAASRLTLTGLTGFATASSDRFPVQVQVNAAAAVGWGTPCFGNRTCASWNQTAGTLEVEVGGGNLTQGTGYTVQWELAELETAAWRRASYLEGWGAVVCSNASQTATVRGDPVTKVLAGGAVDFGGLSVGGGGGMHRLVAMATSEMGEGGGRKPGMDGYSQEFMIGPSALNLSSTLLDFYPVESGRLPSQPWPRRSVSVAVLGADGRVLGGVVEGDVMEVSVRLLKHGEDVTELGLEGFRTATVDGGVAVFDRTRLVAPMGGSGLQFQFSLHNGVREVNLTVGPWVQVPSRLLTSFDQPMISTDVTLEEFTVSLADDLGSVLTSVGASDAFYANATLLRWGGDVTEQNVAGTRSVLVDNGVASFTDLTIIGTAGANFSLVFSLHLPAATRAGAASVLSTLPIATGIFCVSPTNLALLDSPYPSIPVLVVDYLLPTLRVQASGVQGDRLGDIAQRDQFYINVSVLDAQGNVRNDCLDGEGVLEMQRGAVNFTALKFQRIAGPAFALRFSLLRPAHCAAPDAPGRPLTLTSAPFEVHPFRLRIAQLQRAPVSVSAAQHPPGYLRPYTISIDGTPLPPALMHYDSLSAALLPTVVLEAVDVAGNRLACLTEADGFVVEAAAFNDQAALPLPSQPTASLAGPTSVRMSAGQAVFRGLSVITSGNATVRFALAGWVCSEESEAGRTSLCADLQVTIKPFVAFAPHLDPSALDPLFPIDAFSARAPHPVVTPDGNAYATLPSPAEPTRLEGGAGFEQAVVDVACQALLPGANATCFVEYSITCPPPFDTPACPATPRWGSASSLAAVAAANVVVNATRVLLAGHRVTARDSPVPTNMMTAQRVFPEALAGTQRRVGALPASLTLHVRSIVDGLKPSFPSQSTYSLPPQAVSPEATLTRETTSAMAGLWLASSWNPVTRVLPDQSFHNLDAIISEGDIVVGDRGAGNGAAFDVNFVRGGFDTVLAIPRQAVPEAATICSVTRRVLLSNATGSILQGAEPTAGGVWAHGAELLGPDAAFFEDNSTDWTILCGQSAFPFRFVKSRGPGTAEAINLVSNVSVVDVGNLSSVDLAINRNKWSNWSMYEIAVFPRALTALEVDHVVAYYETVLSAGEGTTRPDVFSLIWDRSAAYCGSVLQVPCQTPSARICSSGSRYDIGDGDGYDGGLVEKPQGVRLTRDYTPLDAEVYVESLKDMGFENYSLPNNHGITITVGANRGLVLLGLDYDSNIISIRPKGLSATALYDDAAVFARVDNACAAQETQVSVAHVRSDTRTASVFYQPLSRNQTMLSNSTDAVTKASPSLPPSGGPGRPVNQRVMWSMSEKRQVELMASVPGMLPSLPTIVTMDIDRCRRGDRGLCKCIYFCTYDRDVLEGEDNFCAPYSPYENLFANTHVANQPAAGQTTLTISGEFFCANTVSVQMRAGAETHCEASVWNADTSIRCKLASGSRGTLRMVATAVFRVGTLTEAWTYDHSSLSVSLHANTYASLSRSVTVAGMNLGDYLVSHQGRIGRTACEATNWVSDTDVSLKRSGGHSASARLMMTAGNNLGTTTEMFSHDLSLNIVAANTSSFVANRPATGSSSLTVTGAYVDFAFASITPRMKIGDTTAEATAWESGTAIRCSVAGGTAVSARILLTVGSNVATLTEAASFDTLVLSAMVAHNFAKTGSKSVTLHGAMLGSESHSPSVRSYTNAEQSAWVSDTSAVCIQASGHRRTTGLTITAGARAGSLTEAVSYALPAMSSVTRTNHASSGSQSVTLHGAAFGAAARCSSSRTGWTGMEATSWQSETTLVCLEAAGLRDTLVMALTLGIAAGSATELASFELPSAFGTTNFALRPASHLTEISVKGASLGSFDFSPVTRAGHTTGETSEWISDSAVVCLASDRFFGVGGSLQMLVTAGIRAGTHSDATSYTTPIIAAASNMAQQSITQAITGVMMGFSDYSARGRWGGTACEGTDWTSESSVSCRMSAYTMATLQISMTVGIAAGSMTDAASFDLPSLSGMWTMNVPQTGRNVSSITIVGGKLGTTDHSGWRSLRVASTQCEASEWITDTTVSCMTTMAIGQSGGVAVTMGSRVGSTTEAVSYDNPMLRLAFLADNLNYTNIPASGGMVSTMHGTMMGWGDNSGASRVGGTSCEASVWMSASSMTCIASDTVHQTQRVSMTVGVSAASATETVSFDSLLLTGAWQTNRPQQGGNALAIFGGKLGTMDHSVRARVASTQCDASGWLTDTAVSCMTTMAIGQSGVVAVTMGSRVGSTTEAVSYDVADLSSLVSANTPASGMVFVTMYGHGLGTFASSVQMRLGGSGAEASTWLSTSQVTAIIPSGIANLLLVSVTAGSRGGSMSKAFSYNNPALIILETSTGNSSEWPTSPLPTRWAGPRSGGNVLTLNGESFGMRDYSAVVKIGNTTCDNTTWISDETVLCNVPAVEGWGGLATNDTACLEPQGCQVNHELSFDFNISVGNPESRRLESSLSYVYACQCDSTQCFDHGYVQGGATSYCADVNECDASACNGTLCPQNNCDQNALCTNTNGSFTCACNLGYGSSRSTGGSDLIGVQSQCERCEPTTYKDSIGNSNCSLCGTYSAGGATNFSECEQPAIRWLFDVAPTGGDTMPSVGTAAGLSASITNPSAAGLSDAVQVDGLGGTKAFNITDNGLFNVFLQADAASFITMYQSAWSSAASSDRNSFTLAYWINPSAYPSAFPNRSVVFNFETAAATGAGYIWAAHTSAETQMIVSDGDGECCFGSTPGNVVTAAGVPLNTWTHVAFTFSVQKYPVRNGATDYTISQVAYGFGVHGISQSNSWTQDPVVLPGYTAPLGVNLFDEVYGSTLLTILSGIDNTLSWAPDLFGGSWMCPTRALNGSYIPVRLLLGGQVECFSNTSGACTLSTGSHSTDRASCQASLANLPRNVSGLKTEPSAGLNWTADFVLVQYVGYASEPAYDSLGNHDTSSGFDKASVTITFPPGVGFVLKKYKIFCSSWRLRSCPGNWTVDGSNDLASWETLSMASGYSESDWGSSIEVTVAPAPSTEYENYRLTVHSLAGNSTVSGLNAMVNIDELELWGAEEMGVYFNGVNATTSQSVDGSKRLPGGSSGLLQAAAIAGTAAIDDLQWWNRALNITELAYLQYSTP